MPEFVLNTREAPPVKTRRRRDDAADSPRDPGRARAKKPVPMGDDEFVGAFRLAMSDAEEYIDGHIAPLRATALRFYRGEPLGNEEIGRSQVVMTETRDAVLAILPSLMRIFTSGERVVEFIPSAAQYIDQAEQQTTLAEHVFMQDNPGFLNLYSVFKDALRSKIGIIKWRWADEQTVTETQFTGLAPEQVALLKKEQGVAIVGDIEESDRPETPEGAPKTYDVRIKRTVPRNRIIIECIPPEEFIIARDARDVETAAFCGHRSYKTVSDLVAMGFDPAVILANMGGGDMFAMNYEGQARNPAIFSFMSAWDNTDDAMRRVLTIEGYMRVDRDGDGIAELRKIIAIGDAYHVLDDEMVDEAPFALFCPDPEPHMVFGQSVSDQTMDLQLIKSNMVRNLLDSLAGAIHPRTVVVEGRVNLDDAMNTEQGAIIRTKEVSAVNELVKPFIGQEALTVMAYVDQIRSKRTGVTDASQGLDPQILQSATHAAVSATVSGAQERIELYARIFAESLARLFRGVARMLRANQDQARVVKLSGQWVPVDPRMWQGDLECVPNVALGKGTDPEKIQFLGLIASKIELAIQTLGPANPIAGIDKWANVMRQATVLAGFKDASRFFSQPPPEYMQHLQQMAANPPPNPQMAMVEVEKTKVQQDHARKMIQLQQQAANDADRNDIERDRIHVNALTAMAQADASHERDVHSGRIELALEHSRAQSKDRLAHLGKMHQVALGHIADAHATDTQAHVDHRANQMNADVQRETAARNAEVAERTGMAKAAQRPAKAK